MTKSTVLFSLFFLSISVKTIAQQKLDKINWPPQYEPAKSKFYVHNEIDINASPQVVWDILVDALKWESYYKGAKNVVLINPNDKILQANSIFKWETMGLKFQSTIKEYIPNQLLAWESKKKNIQGYHVWLIVPTAKGCKVITDELQNGWLTFFEKTFQPKKLQRLHDVWLLELKKKAEKTNQK